MVTFLGGFLLEGPPREAPVTESTAETPTGLRPERAAGLPGAGLTRDFMMRSNLAVGAVYPFWHLLAPSASRDPWLGWWAVAACFLAVAGLAKFSRLSDTTIRRLFNLCPGLVTGQLMVLGHLNDMHVFYAVGATMALVSTAVSLRSFRGLLTYSAFVAGLAAFLYALAPDFLKLAYWLGPLPVLLGAAYRFSVQLDQARAVDLQQEELERRVRERTAELEHANDQLRREMEERELLEDQLRLSQKMQAVGRLAGGIAHDFNNLLTVIGNYADLVRRRTDDPAVARDTDEIIRAGEKATRLTKRLLSFARGGVIQPTVLDLNEVLRDTRRMVDSINGEDVEAEYELAEDLLCVRADRGQLEQALLNLVLNARDAMPDGGKLTVSTRNLAPAEFPEWGLAVDGSAQVVLSIRDTGVGMDAATQSRAFEPFFTTKAPDDGTGLGLAMVYGLAEQSGGSARIRSEPGQGTCVELAFAGVLETAVRSSRLPRRSTPRANGECVLLVEDDATVRQVTRRVLRDAGYTVLDAEDGDVALVILEETHDEVELVLTDVVMPRMSGLELAQRIAKERPALPVLFLSGQMNHPSLAHRELPPDAQLLPKPFNPSQLLERVAEVLGLGAELPRG